jgi:hypothetical protein
MEPNRTTSRLFTDNVDWMLIPIKEKTARHQRYSGS